jgi:protein SCO1
MRLSPISAVLLFCALLAGCSQATQPMPGYVVAEPVALAPFRLIDHRGNNSDTTNLKGRWTFMFFGYTSCPDVCPATLTQLSLVRAAIVAQFGEERAPNILLVSVDPERDTPDRLAQYLAGFGPHFVGATGDVAMIASLQEQLGSGKQRAVEGREEATIRQGEEHAHHRPPALRVDHAADVYLIDPEARLHARFAPLFDSNELAQRFTGIKARYDRQVAERALLPPAYAQENSATHAVFTTRNQERR